MIVYDLSFEEKKELELNISNFKKEKFDDFIQSGILIGELAKNIKDKKELYLKNIDSFSPIWIRLMSEEVDNIINKMQEVIYQINQSEKKVKDKNDINNLEKYKKILLKKEKTKKILKPFLPIIKNRYLVEKE